VGLTCFDAGSARQRRLKICQNHSFTNKIQLMAKKKKAVKKVDPQGTWFTKRFKEGDSGDTRIRKRRLIEKYFEGYLRAYNDEPTHITKFEFIRDEDNPFRWTIVQDNENGTIHELEVIITPAPIVSGGGGSTTDPPNPAHPPPKMT